MLGVIILRFIMLKSKEEILFYSVSVVHLE